MSKAQTAIKSFFAELWFKIKNFFVYNPKGKKPRIWELDILRGIILIMVTFDHCCTFGYAWNLIPYQTEFGMKLYDFAYRYYGSNFRHAIQPVGLFLICFLSGINCSFAKSSFSRVLKFWIFCGVFMGGYSLLGLYFPEYIGGKIIFNIIAVLTICFTLWWLMDLIKCPSWIRIGLAIVIILLGIYGYYQYEHTSETWTFKSDFVSLLFYSSQGIQLSRDNFEPLFPHLGFFLVGGVLGKYLYKDRKTLCKTELPPKYLYPVLMVGKHSLAAYLVAPVIILLLVKAIVLLVGVFI